MCVCVLCVLLFYIFCSIDGHIPDKIKMMILCQIDYNDKFKHPASDKIILYSVSYSPWMRFS